MKRSGTAAALCLAIWMPIQYPSAEAYELRTHAEITQRAFAGSTGVASYMSDVSIDPKAVFDFASRTRADQLADFNNTGTPRDWMIEGAIREDDYSRNPLLEAAGCDGPRNPPSSIDRMLNHFLNVQGDRGGLTVGGLVLGNPAPDWALRRFPLAPNAFTLLDARTYQLLSLTEAQKSDRDKNTALLFRALGHVIHLVQDMAQPQHTRNDLHAGCGPALLPQLPIAGAPDQRLLAAIVQAKDGAPFLHLIYFCRDALGRWLIEEM